MQSMDGRYIAYYRVSTERQGRSGLGLEAQQAAVMAFLNGGNWKLIDYFTEIESGKHDDRPQLARAIEQCRLTGSTLLVAKLDRLSRDAAFLLGLSKSGIDIRAADMPEANAMVFGIMAVVAQYEREQISRRTRDALGAAKARGTKMGGFRGHVVDHTLGVAARQKAADAFAASVAPTIRELQAEGLSLRQVAARLVEKGIRTAQGGQWTPTAVKNVLERAA
jgi:DNA invertase Pin-like site-specific DNA recombinase